IACEGNPAQCFIRRNLSSSAAAISLPSRTSAAEESAWKAFRPRIIIAFLILLLTSVSAPRLTTSTGTGSQLPLYLRPPLTKALVAGDPSLERVHRWAIAMAMVDGQLDAHQTYLQHRCW